MEKPFRFYHLLFTIIGVAFILFGIAIHEAITSIWSFFVKSQTAPFEKHGTEFIGHVFTEIGIAFVVAVLVSMLWEFHHRKHVEKRLLSLDADIKNTNLSLQDCVLSATSRVERASKNIEDASKTFLETHATTALALASSDIEMVYRRYSNWSDDKQELDPTFHDQIVEAVERAEKFILLGGRAFNDSLLTRQNNKKTLRTALEEKLKGTPGITLLLSYGSTAHSESSELLQEYMFRHESYSEMLGRQRQSLRLLFLLLARAIGQKYNPTKLISVRALTLPPAFWMLATEKTLFFDPYLPFKYPGETFVFKVRPAIGMDDFDVRETLMECTPYSDGTFSRNTIDGNPYRFSMWDSDGELVNDQSLYIRIIKSFLAQFAIRGSKPSEHFSNFLSRNESLTDKEVKKWNEIIEAAKIIEAHSEAFLNQKVI